MWATASNTHHESPAQLPIKRGRFSGPEPLLRGRPVEGSRNEADAYSNFGQKTAPPAKRQRLCPLSLNTATSKMKFAGGRKLFSSPNTDLGSDLHLDPPNMSKIKCGASQGLQGATDRPHSPGLSSKLGGSRHYAPSPPRRFC